MYLAARRPRPLHPAVRHFRLPERLPDGRTFALLTDDAQARAIACDSLGGLARCILRRRHGAALRLAPARVEFRDEVRDVVEVRAEELDGEGQPNGRTRLIGHAWLSGRDWRVLQAALEAELPNRRAA